MTTKIDDTVEARRAALLREAEQRGVKPIVNINDFHGDFWDTRDETTEDFDAWLRRTRAEGDNVRLGEGRNINDFASVKERESNFRFARNAIKSVKQRKA